MTRLFEPARRWWWSRTDRERQMLAVMVLLVAAVLAWLAVVRPAVAWREVAAERRVEARETLLKVDAGLRRLSRQPKDSPAAPADATRRADLVTQTASAAGVSITTGMDASGGLGFRAERTTSAQLFPWLAKLQAEHGFEVSRLTVVENADATLQAEGAFEFGASPSA